MARFDANRVGRAVAEAVREIFPISTSGGLPAYPGVVLRLGANGESVRQVQRCLNRVGQRHPSIGTLAEDGIFGPRTQASVIAFQRIFGLNPDGIVGPLTWARLATECGSSGGGSGGGLPAYPGVVLRLGANGESVRQVQRCLNRVAQRHSAIGTLTEDGIFGPRTQTSVIAFQRIFGLNPDGIVGPLTWARIAQECAITTQATDIEATRLTARDTFGVLLLLSVSRFFR